MKIFFAKGLWAIPMYGAVLLLVWIFILLLGRVFESIERAKYQRRLERAHRYRSF